MIRCLVFSIFASIDPGMPRTQLFTELMNMLILNSLSFTLWCSTQIKDITFFRRLIHSLYAVTKFLQLCHIIDCLCSYEN